jgi:signal transduction histidine kinase
VIKNGFKELTVAEGAMIKELLSLAGFHLTEHGETSMRRYLETLFENKRVVYIGLEKENNLIFLKSRYEGFFPFRESKKNYNFLNTPVGRIFEVKSRFTGYDRKTYRFIVGFDYKFLSSFEKSSERNFILIFGILFFLTFMFVLFLYFYNRQMYLKDLEVIKAREEKGWYRDLTLLTSEIAHEIKNPLNSIYLSFNAIEKYLNSDDDSRFYKKAIKDEIKRITEIINTYSSLSKPPDVKIEKFPISELFEQIALIRKEEFKKFGIILELDYIDFELFSGKDILRQIFANLINNAVESSAKKIIIKAVKDKRYVEFQIIDDGHAFDPEIKKDLFKPLITSKMNNMGLGLNITFKLVKSLNGKIELLSSEEGNKVFKIVVKG